MEDTVTKEWVEQMIDLTSLGHLNRSKANDPNIGFLIEVKDPDLELADVGLAFTNSDVQSIRDWYVAGRIGGGSNGDQIDKSAVHCYRLEPMYLYKRSGGLYE